MSIVSCEDIVGTGRERLRGQEVHVIDLAEGVTTLQDMTQLHHTHVVEVTRQAVLRIQVVFTNSPIDGRLRCCTDLPAAP